MMSDETVLVTGACGEIGQALVQELSKRGRLSHCDGGYDASAGYHQEFIRRARARGFGIQDQNLLRL